VILPPLHITGSPTADWIIFTVAGIVCLYWLRALRLAREGARLLLRNLAKAALVFAALVVALSAIRNWTRLNSSQEQLIAFIGAVISMSRFQSRRRSRYIPKATRRAVVARDLRGEQYDPRKHHIDHVWPFSKGGSHTFDNLRVIEKKKNLRKGAKRPGLREMW
jgi:hypothetical protein